MKEAVIDKDEQIFSPGMRVKIRDAEWFVRRVSPVKTGGQALFVRGITCPVQGRDQIFWTEAERDAEGGIAIEVILPENTVLSLDTSSHAARTRLRIESVVRHNPVSCGSKEWEVIKDMPSGEFKKTITETVFSDTPTERTIIYKAPFFKKCREDDYKEAWEMLVAREG